MEKGIIKRLFADRGFGFISREQKEDLFFHFSALQGARFADLREGLEAEFEDGLRQLKPLCISTQLNALLLAHVAGRKSGFTG